MKLVARILRASVKKRLDCLEAEHYRGLDAASFQLGRIRALWPRWQEKMPDRLPTEPPRSLESFCEQTPSTSRSDLKAWVASAGHTGAAWRATGGSSGEPLRFPVARPEINAQAECVWLLRRWAGIEPAARAALIWGHSHMLGEGWRGRLARIKRELADRALGFLRCSAYDLSRSAVAEYVQTIRRHQPEYVVGYSAALDQFVRIAEFVDGSSLGASPRVVIATGEALPFADSRQRIEAYFGCPLRMEYGCVEAGSVAQESEPGHYRVAWHGHFVERDEDGELLVTSLFERAMPLIRYRTGDRVALRSERTIGLTGFGVVDGRKNPLIALPSGACVHSEAVAHAVREVDVVDAYQLQFSQDQLRLAYVARRELSEVEHAAIRSRLAKIERELGGIPVCKVEQLRRTAAGKTPQVIH